MTDALVLDELGRVPIAEGMKRRIDEALRIIPTLPDGRPARGALLVLGDETGVRAHLAARVGERWKVAGALGVPWEHPRRPSGWVGIEGYW